MRTIRRPPAGNFTKRLAGALLRDTPRRAALRRWFGYRAPTGSPRPWRCRLATDVTFAEAPPEYLRLSRRRIAGGISRRSGSATQAALRDVRLSVAFSLGLSGDDTLSRALLNHTRTSHELLSAVNSTFERCP
jgi:hypothetical protein